LVAFFFPLPLPLPLRGGLSLSLSLSSESDTAFAFAWIDFSRDPNSDERTWNVVMTTSNFSRSLPPDCQLAGGDPYLTRCTLGTVVRRDLEETSLGLGADFGGPLLHDCEGGNNADGLAVEVVTPCTHRVPPL
jgi:hypothetical protein